MADKTVKPVKYITVKEIVDRTSIPENTIRRYLGLVDDHITKKKDGRSFVYPEEALVIIRKMNSLFMDGKTTSQVIEELDIPHITTMEHGQDTARPGPGQSAGSAVSVNNGEELMEAMVMRITERIREQAAPAEQKLIEENAKLRQQVDDLKQQNVELKSTVDSIYKEMTQFIKENRSTNNEGYFQRTFPSIFGKKQRSEPNGKETTT